MGIPESRICRSFSVCPLFSDMSQEGSTATDSKGTSKGRNPPRGLRQGKRGERANRTGGVVLGCPPQRLSPIKKECHLRSSSSSSTHVPTKEDSRERIRTSPAEMVPGGTR